MKFLFRNAVLLLALVACVPANKPSDEEVLSVAKSEGERIAGIAQKALGSQLMKAMSEGGPSHALTFCQVAAMPILDTLTTGFHVKVRRASDRNRNEIDSPTPQELKVLEGYRATLDSGKTLHSSVAVLNDEQVLFAMPILLNNPMCLKCHGAVGTDIDSSTYGLINRLYPNDKATGHALGDLRGIWSLTFSKAELTSLLK